MTRADIFCVKYSTMRILNVLMLVSLTVASGSRFASVEFCIIDKPEKDQRHLCRGLLLAEDWLVTSAECLTWSPYFHVETIDRRHTDVNGVFTERWILYREDDSTKMDYQLLRAFESITKEEFRFLDIGLSHDWNHVKSALVKICAGGDKDMFVAAVEMATGVEHSICTDHIEGTNVTEICKFDALLGGS